MKVVTKASVPRKKVNRGNEWGVGWVSRVRVKKERIEVRKM